MLANSGKAAGSGEDTGGRDRFAAWSFKLPKKIISLNVLRKYPTYAYRKYRDEWIWYIRIIASGAEQRPLWQRIDPGRRRNKSVGPVKSVVRITRYGLRELDDDNLRGGCKPLIDALVCEGLIYDDSPKWMRASYEQVQASEWSTDIHVAYTELPA